MKDYINIGAVPCEEDCAQVGREGYREQAVKECKRFIELLRKTFGDEPEGARLAIKWFDHGKEGAASSSSFRPGRRTGFRDVAESNSKLVLYSFHSGKQIRLPFSFTRNSCI